MRKFLVPIALVIWFIAVSAISVQAKKAGEVKDGVFTDEKFGYSLNFPDGWGENIKSSKSAIRAVLVEKSYPVPRQFQGGGKEDYATIPTITIMADTTSYTTEQFLDSMLQAEDKSKQMDYFARNTKIISRPYEIEKRQELTIGDNKGLMIVARQQYSLEVSERGSDRADVVNDYKSGIVFVMVVNGQVISINGICERAFISNYIPVFQELIESIKFSEQG